MNKAIISFSTLFMLYSLAAIATANPVGNDSLDTLKAVPVAPESLVRSQIVEFASNRRPTFCFAGTPGELYFLYMKDGNWMLRAVHIRPHRVNHFQVVGLSDDGWELVSVLGPGRPSESLYFYRLSERRTGELAVGRFLDGQLMIERHTVFPLDQPSETGALLMDVRHQYRSRISQASAQAALHRPISIQLHLNNEPHEILFSRREWEWVAHVLRSGEYLGAFPLALAPSGDMLFVSTAGTRLYGIYLAWTTDGASYAGAFSYNIGPGKLLEATKGPTGVVLLCLEREGKELFTVLDFREYIEHLRSPDVIQYIQW